VPHEFVQVAQRAVRETPEDARRAGEKRTRGAAGERLVYATAADRDLGSLRRERFGAPDELRLRAPRRMVRVVVHLPGNAVRQFAA
jgi:hypothetical protein